MSDEEMAMNAAAEPVAGPSTTTTTATVAPTDGQAPLSKNAQKRLAKRARFESFKLEKRAAERTRRKERTAFLQKGFADGTLSADDHALVEKQRALKRARRQSAKGTDSAWPGAVVIDCAFDELMTEQEISSMNSQLAYVYSINRTSKVPFGAVLHTGFGPGRSPRLFDKMAKNAWHRWARMHFWEEDVDVLSKVMKEGAAKEAEEGDEVVKATEETTTTAEPSTEVDPANPATLVPFLSGPRLPATIPATHKLVYLSADADEELTTLSEDEVYIIGGIVDRNRHKMLCQNKAEGLGIRTARLPIGTYLADLPTRKVLTVNQVFEILTQYLALKDWAAAFEAVIPQRKYFVGKEAKNKARKAGEGDDGEAVADEEEEEAAAAGGEDAAMDEEDGATNAVATAPEDEEAAMNA